jgi:hypothetical protein
MKNDLFDGERNYLRSKPKLKCRQQRLFRLSQRIRIFSDHAVILGPRGKHSRGDAFLIEAINQSSYAKGVEGFSDLQDDDHIVETVMSFV